MGNMGSPAGYYEFKEDNGTWRPCKSSAEIADALAKGMSELNLGKHKIVLDSTPMKQINLKTQKERELRFVAVQWQTSDVHEWPRTWTDLPPDESGAVRDDRDVTEGEAEKRNHADFSVTVHI